MSQPSRFVISYPPVPTTFRIGTVIQAGGGGSMTAAQILTALKTVDGSGSGLDADLLDGESISYFAPASALVAEITARQNADASLSAAKVDKNSNFEDAGLRMATNRLLGRTTAEEGAVEEIAAGAHLQLSGGQISAVASEGGGGGGDSAKLLKFLADGGLRAMSLLIRADANDLGGIRLRTGVDDQDRDVWLEEPGGDNWTLAYKEWVTAQIDAIIAAAPGALDTLNELAAALGDDANFAATVTNALAGKAPAGVVLLTTDTGAVTAYTPASDTDIARGAALIAALTALTAGSTLVVGAGTYDLEDNEITVPDGTAMIGHGATLLFAPDGIGMNIGAALVQGFTIREPSMITGYALLHFIGNGRLRNCDVYGRTDIFNGSWSGCTDVWLENCVFGGQFDILTNTCIPADCVCHMVNCHVRVDGTGYPDSALASGPRITQGTLNIYGGSIRAENSNIGATFNRAVDCSGTGIINLFDVRLVVTSGGYDLRTGVGSGTINVCGGVGSGTNGAYTTNGTGTINYSSADYAALVAGLAPKVTGPASSTDSAIPIFDGTTGKLLKNGLGTNATTAPSLNLGTITDTTSRGLTLTQTWNNAGLTASAFTINVTDTNSAAASALASFRVGGTNVALVRKDGVFLSAPAGSASAPNFASSSAPTTGLWTNGSTSVGLTLAGAARITATSSTVALHGTGECTGTSFAVTNANAGATTLSVINVSADAAAHAYLRAYNGSYDMAMGILGTNYTTSGGLIQGGAFLINYSPAGISFIQNNAAGTVRFYTGGFADANRRLVINADGTMNYEGITLNLGGGTSSTELRFLEPSGSGSHYTAIKAAAQAANITYTWPTTAPTAGRRLKSDGSGQLSWTDEIVQSGFTLHGSAVTTGKVKGWTVVPYDATIVGWNMSVDAGTATVKVWKIATGPNVPTNANSINTSGVGISSGTHVRSSTLTDFTTTAVAAGDIIAYEITTVATATELAFNLELKKA